MAVGFQSPPAMSLHLGHIPWEGRDDDDHHSPRDDAPEAITGIRENVTGANNSSSVVDHVPPTQSFCEILIAAPKTPREIFCQSPTGRLGEDIFKFRIRDGNVDFINNFLAHVVGADANFDIRKVLWDGTPPVSVPHHLVEVLRYQQPTEGGPFTHQAFHCAVAETRPDSWRDPLEPPKYRLLPQPNSLSGSSRGGPDGLKLETASFVKCGSCGQLYEINIYR